MIQTDNTGRHLMCFETNAVIRRIPMERRGTARSGRGWVMGSVVIEAFEDAECESALLYLITWQEEMIETLNILGVGKKCKVKFHIECREYYDSYKTSLMLDEIEGLSEGENFLYNTKKKGDAKDAQ